MKQLAIIGCTVLVAIATSGCMSPGGLTVGPFSSYTTTLNERHMTERAVLQSQGIQVEKKAQILHAVNMSSSPREVAIGMGVDILALADGGFTIKELALNAVGVLGDAALAAGATYAISSSFNKTDSSSKTATMTINGDQNTVVQGSGSVTMTHNQPMSQGDSEGSPAGVQAGGDTKAE